MVNIRENVTAAVKGGFWFYKIHIITNVFMIAEDLCGHFTVVYSPTGKTNLNTVRCQGQMNAWLAAFGIK